MKHGMTRTTEFKIWQGILDRCRRPTNRYYARYGGRGIRVAKEWSDFAAFLAYVGPRPSVRHTIDRIDNNGHYEPGNVRWASWEEQQRNRSSNVFLEDGGTRRTISEWATITGIKKATLAKRKRSGWTDYECIHGLPDGARYKNKPARRTLDTTDAKEPGNER